MLLCFSFLIIGFDLGLSSPSPHRDRPSAADCMTHPWLWQQHQYPSTEPVMPRTPRERSSGTKWAAPAEDPEDKENFTLDSPHTQAKKFRFEEETPAATNGGDGDF